MRDEIILDHYSSHQKYNIVWYYLQLPDSHSS
jgi:hypothetical protein